MIAKVIAYGRTRSEALARLRRALGDTTVLIEGGTTNKGFLLDLLDQPEIIDGSADTGGSTGSAARAGSNRNGTRESRSSPRRSRRTRSRSGPSGCTSSPPRTEAGRRPGTSWGAPST